MANQAVMQHSGANAGSNGAGKNAAPIPTVPFIRASSEHREPAGIDLTRALTAGLQDLGTFDVPAYGYLRNLVLIVTASGGVGTPTFAEDYPFSILQNLALTEPNGAQIAAFNSGYDAMLANKYGGYRHPLGADPRSSPVYQSHAANGDFVFVLRVPIELNARNTLGSLPNQSAAATFKLRCMLNAGSANGGLYAATAPTTLPNVRVQAYIEAWDQPSGGQGGASNQVTPPAMNTTQFWSTQIFNVNAGQQTIRLTRVGNYIRNLILIQRRAGAGRLLGDVDFPDPMSLFLDTRPTETTIPRILWKNTMFERSGFGGRPQGGALATVPVQDTAGGLDSGVYVYDFTHDFNGILGLENNDLWLPTLGSTRLEIQGSFANAGTLTVLTNDVAPAGSVFI